MKINKLEILESVYNASCLDFVHFLIWLLCKQLRNITKEHNNGTYRPPARRLIRIDLSQYLRPGRRADESAPDTDRTWVYVTWIFDPYIRPRHWRRYWQWKLEYFKILLHILFTIKWLKGILIHNIIITNMNFSDALTSYTTLT